MKDFDRIAHDVAKAARAAIASCLRIEANAIAQRGGEDGPVGALWFDRAATFLEERPRSSVARSASSDTSAANGMKDTTDSTVAELAKVLLAVEWAATWVGDHPSCCPMCCGAKPGSFGVRETEIGHKPDCALEAALRKAGVR